MERKQKNFRMPQYTLDQLATITEVAGLNETQIVILAVDRFAHELGLTRQEIEAPDEVFDRFNR